jgi:hypothetical protein
MKYSINEKDDYYGYIYITLDQRENKVYVGYKKGKIEKSKNYFGSGTIIRRIIKKYGKDFLKKTVLGVCYSKEELIFWETECKHFFKALDRRYGYNILEKDTFGDTFTNHPDKEITREKLRTTSTGRPQTIESRQKRSISCKKARDGNKRLSEISAENGRKNKGKTAWNKGLTKETDSRIKPQIAWNKGKKGIFTEETLKKISLSGKENFEYRKSLVDKDLLLILYNNGFSMSQIAKKLGITKQMTKSIFKDLNLSLERSIYLRIIDNNIKDIIDKYKSGFTLLDIAILYKVNVASITKRLKQNGVDIYRKDRKDNRKIK